MNWGNKLIIVFVGFAALMSTLVYKCMHQDFQLVSKDYYNEELRYQERINGLRNAGTAGAVTIEQSAGVINLRLPGTLKGLALQGQVHFYCPANAANDVKLPPDFNNDGDMQVNKSQLTPARYLVKISLNQAETPYYYEQSITISTE